MTDDGDFVARRKQLADEQEAKDEARRNKARAVINEALEAVVTDYDCPRCHMNGWSTVDKFTPVTVTGSLQVASGGVIGAVTQICAHCGFMAMHSTDVLKLGRHKFT